MYVGKFMKFWLYIKPYKYQAFLGFIFKIFEAGFELMIPLIMANIIDKGIINGDTDYILRQGVILVSFSTLGYLCALVCQYYASVTSQSVGTKLRTDIYHKINTLTISQTEKFGASSLVTRVTGDVIQIQQAIAMTIRLTSRAPFLIMGALVLAFLLNKNLTYIFVVGAVILAIFMTLITLFALKKHTVLQKILDKLTLSVRETIEGSRVIRAFSKQSYHIDNFEKELKEQCTKQIMVGKIQSLSNPMTYLIVNICILLIVYQGGLQVSIGNLSQGEVIALVNYMTQILLALIVYTNVMTLYNKAGVSYKRVKELLNDEDTNHYGFEQVSIDEIAISFNGVSFGYENNYVIHNLSFDVLDGESIGIIGGTGCGKSTIIKLINRFYNCNEGIIKIHGDDITTIDNDSLRNMISYVPQESILFSGTIASNLKMAHSSASNDEMLDALKKAQAGDFVLNDQDLLKVVEQGGKNLSGGQRQRVCIARALIKNSNILILDDSSSALDNLTERHLKEVLNNIDCTKIFVSQKVSTIRELDKIIVLDKGRITGIGKHDFLLESCDVYKEIYSSQNKEVS